MPVSNLTRTRSCTRFSQSSSICFNEAIVKEISLYLFFTIVAVGVNPKTRSGCMMPTPRNTLISKYESTQKNGILSALSKRVAIGSRPCPYALLFRTGATCHFGASEWMACRLLRRANLLSSTVMRGGSFRNCRHVRRFRSKAWGIVKEYHLTSLSLNIVVTYPPCPYTKFAVASYAIRDVPCVRCRTDDLHSVICITMARNYGKLGVRACALIHFVSERNIHLRSAICELQCASPFDCGSEVTRLCEAVCSLRRGESPLRRDFGEARNSSTVPQR